MSNFGIELQRMGLKSFQSFQKKESNVSKNAAPVQINPIWVIASLMIVPYRS